MGNIKGGCEKRPYSQTVKSFNSLLFIKLRNVENKQKLFKYTETKFHIEQMLSLLLQSIAIFRATKIE